MSYGNYEYQNQFVNSTNNFVNSDNNINTSSIDEDINIFEDSINPMEKTENTIEKGDFAVSSLDKDIQEEIISNFESQLEELQTDFERTKNEKGWISGLWDGFKNLTGIGAGSNKTQEQIDKMKNAISDFKNGKIDFAQTYKNITNNDLTDEELQKYTNGEVKPKALESVEKYSEGQRMAVDTVADIVSGIAAVGAVALGTAIGICAAPFTAGASFGLIAAGIGIAAGVGAGVKTAIKASDCIGNEKKYSLKDAGYDTVTGSINGALAPVTNALGGAAGTATMKALGMEALETTVKSAAITGGKEVIEEGAQAVVKQGGKQIAKKAVSATVDMAVDGSLSGAADGFSRALAEGRTEDILSDSAAGFVGGLVAAPIIGGGFKIAGKAGSKIGNTNIAQAAGKEISDITGDVGEKISKALPNGLTDKISVLGDKINGKYIAATLKNSVTKENNGNYNVKIGKYIVKLSSEEVTEEMRNDTSNKLIFDYAQGVLDKAILNTLPDPVSDVLTKDVSDKVVKESSSKINDTIAKSASETEQITNIVKNKEDKTIDAYILFLFNDKLGSDGIERAKIFKDAGFEDFFACDYATTITDEADIQKVINQKNAILEAGFNNGYACKYANILDTDGLGRATKLKNAGITDKFACEYAAKLDSDGIERVKIFKNAGFEEDIACEHALNITDKTQIQKVINQKNAILEAGFNNEYACKYSNILDTDGLGRATKLKNGGITDEFACEYAQKLDSDGIEKAIKLKKANVGDYIACEYAQKLDSDGVERAIKLKKAGITEEFACDYAQKLDSDGIKKAKKLKNAGFEDRYVCDIAQKLDSDGIKKAIRLKNAGVEELYACNIAQKLDSDGIKKAIQLKNEGISDYIACDFAQELDSDCIEKAIRLKNEGFIEFSAFNYAQELDSDGIERAVQLKNAEFDDSYAFSLAQKLDSAGIERAIRLKNAGFDDGIANVYVNKLDDIDSEIAIMFKNVGAKQHDACEYAVNLDKLKKTDIDLSSCSSYEKMDLKNFVLSVKTAADSLTMNEDMNNIQKDAINKLKSIDYDTMLKNIYDNLHNTITPTEVSDEAIKSFSKGFLANNSNIESILGNTDFTKFSEGIPLEYNRTEFLSDISNIVKNSSSIDEQNALFKKLGIEIIKDNNGNITGYNGIIDLDITPENNTEKEILDCAKKFIKNNKIETGDNELDSALNSLIEGFPEFINIIGKKQHGTHNLSVDAHILQVLKEAVSNDAYNDLSDTDKTCLKLATVFHDIAKSEGVVDTSHPEASAFYVRNLMEKLPFSENIKDRVIELVKNHHWLEEYNTGTLTPEYTASLFRHKDDYTIAKIMAESDLKGVSDDFWQGYKSSLDVAKQQPVVDSFNKINSTGQLVFTNKIIKENLIPEVEYNGKNYKVIDFTKQSTPDDLAKVGFEPGTTKDNLRLFIHMAGVQDLDTVMHLSDTAQGSFLCASEVSLKSKKTYGRQKFGVSLEAENINVANISAQNQGSGFGKDFNLFSDIITGKGDYLSDYRNSIPQFIKEELNLSDNEYAQLFEQFAAFKHISQIKDNEIYTFGDKSIQGSKIKKAIQTAQDSMLSDTQNEANLYNPKVNAFVAKVDSVDEIPQEYLDFAEKYNLPIYLLGKDFVFNYNKLAP